MNRAPPTPTSVPAPPETRPVESPFTMISFKLRAIILRLIVSASRVKCAAVLRE